MLKSPPGNHGIKVLLVDDQQIVAEAIRRMLESEDDIEFHYCSDPAQALLRAKELSPTVILQDLVMPDIDGLLLLKFYRANEATRDIPIIVLSSQEEPVTKAKAFGLGASDYLVKLPNRVELIARIRHHSSGYIHLLERNEAFEALRESQRELAEDLAQAERYVTSLLPEKLNSDRLITDWMFIPSSKLGGDSFGYHWLDDQNFACYLLDVCGHGVKSALMSVSAMNVLRAQSLAGCDFRDASQVLSALNNAFLMEKHNEMYFTIWYGVYNTDTRELNYSGAGHPPAILLSGDGASPRKCLQLESQGPMTGVVEDMPYDGQRVDVAPGSLLYLYSDGICELHKPDGSMWPFGEFVEAISAPPPPGESAIERIHSVGRDVQGGAPFVDDFSILEIKFV
ncbi:SpoIIE family protein phosphatase [Schlesneria paludicola]|uniref:SpoIIE family protein phosphatase n=1 Tax=Schlesneria paludicola TaxID=360056 RepID=UPI00029B2E22|nr:SpoIIE family protein phosphatase [Schlesneria paludicola]